MAYKATYKTQGIVKVVCLLSVNKKYLLVEKYIKPPPLYIQAFIVWSYEAKAKRRVNTGGVCSVSCRVFNEIWKC